MRLRSVAARARGPLRQQLVEAYVVAVAAHFQGFARDLHSEVVDYIASHVAPQSLANRNILRTGFINQRSLDRGNATNRNLAQDYAKLSFTLWMTLDRLDNRTQSRRPRLDALIEWRNAIAHQSFDVAQPGGRTIVRLTDGDNWREACGAVAATLDSAMRAHLTGILGRRPW